MPAPSVYENEVANLGKVYSLGGIRRTSFFGSCDNPINACHSCIMRFIFLVIFFSIIRTRASARANNYEKKMTRKINLIMHSETSVNWVITWTKKKTCPAKQINRRKFSPPCEFGCSTAQSSLASLLLLFVLKNPTCSSWCQQTENEKFSFIKHVDFNCSSRNNALSLLLNSKQ